MSVGKSEAAYSNGDQVWIKNDKDSSGTRIKKRYWICCIRVKADGTIEYSLKDAPNGEFTKRVDEARLRLYL